MSSCGPKEPSSPRPDTPQPAAEPQQRRGRGRPRKQQLEPLGPPAPKRPRGRPKGSKNKGSKTVFKKIEPAGARRPKGRPRKWVWSNALTFKRPDKTDLYESLCARPPHSCLIHFTATEGRCKRKRRAKGVFGGRGAGTVVVRALFVSGGRPVTSRCGRNSKKAMFIRHQLQRFPIFIEPGGNKRLTII